MNTNVVDKIRRDIVRLNKSTNISEQMIKEINQKLDVLENNIESLTERLEKSENYGDERKSGILSIFKSK